MHFTRIFFKTNCLIALYAFLKLNSLYCSNCSIYLRDNVYSYFNKTVWFFFKRWWGIKFKINFIKIWIFGIIHFRCGLLLLKKIIITVIKIKELKKTSQIEKWIHKNFNKILLKNKMKKRRKYFENWNA